MAKVPGRTAATPVPPRRFRGHVRAPNKDHIIALRTGMYGDWITNLTVSPPPSWDSRAQGWVGPIKDQAQCGSCWDFSGTGVCEIAFNMVMAGPMGASIVLSEEYILDCGVNGGCNGDDNTNVLAWAEATGIPLTSDYGPYTAGSGSTGSCAWKSPMKLYKIGAWGFADGNGGSGVTPTAAIKAAIMTYGCVGCAIDADDAFEQNPSGTVFAGSTSDPSGIDHDVILVGWDDSLGCWILRNSWGPAWCESGYIRIKYGANLVGTESVWASVAPVPTASDLFIMAGGIS